MTERWKPSPSVAVIVVGLILGMTLGFRGRFTNQAALIQQDYTLLLSDLYYQGAPLASVRDRLLKLGFADASLAVVQSADQLSSSPDKIKQQEADQLHQFAEALASGVDRNAPTPAVMRSAPTAAPDLASTVAPTSVAQSPSALVAVPTAAPNDVPTVVVGVVAAPPAVTAVPTPSTAPRPAPGTRTGSIVSADQKPVFLRHDPTTKSKAVASMPVGATVEIKSTVVGTAVNPGENHWYRVVYGGTDGYVYSQFVQVGG